MSYRLVLALLPLMGLTGCSPDDDFVGCTLPTELSFSPSNPGLVKTGEAGRVFTLPISFQSCSAGASPDPSGATVEIEGPGGEHLASQVELGSFSKPTVIQFTPEQPGPHHVLVEYTPWGGIRQVDVHAVLERSAEAPSQLLPRGCSSLERTSQGAWVCGSMVFRGGTEPVASFSWDRLAVAGEVLWAVGSSSVSRYVDTGTALVQTGSAPRPSGGSDFLLATPDELVVLLNNALTLYTFRDGVVTSAGTTPWTRPGTPIRPSAPYGVLLREDGRVAIATRLSDSSGALVQVCPYQLLSGRFERMPGDCTRFPSEIIGFEPGVLWTKDLPASSSERTSPVHVRRWVWAGGQLQEQGSLSLGPNVRLVEQPLQRPAAVPLVRNAPPDPSLPPSPTRSFPPVISVVTWSPQRQVLLLEHLDAELTEVSASPSLYWGLVPPGSTVQQTRVRPRPPTP